MKRRFILTGFTNYKLLALLNKARTVLAALKGNASFPTPTPPLSDLADAADALDAALALPNSKSATSQRATCRANLILVLNMLAEYVQSNSNNDVTVMLSSGFSVNKVYTKVGVLPQPANFRVSAQPGQKIKLRCKNIYGAHSYSFEYTLIANGATGEWKACQSTKSFTTISGLQKGAEYAFRVAGIGANPAITYSEVTTSVIL